MPKSKRLTLMMIPSGSSRTTQITIPVLLTQVIYLVFISLAALLGYFAFDYSQLVKMRQFHQSLIAENKHLKGEADLLMTHLDDVKVSLHRIQDYTRKLDELIHLKVLKVSQRTGIGPLTAEEFSIQKNQPNVEDNSHAHIPLGINMDNLIFRPELEHLSEIRASADHQAVELQRLLSTLSQKKSLLSSMPSISPVKGWITSDFGMRISPFTGKRSMHKAIDVAAPVGTPIYAPADGVVIFSGRKAGFGNFTMIAHHGYGIVTRYGHNAQNLLRAGQRVRRGDQIATVGMTGRTTGPHLHYEVWVNGQAVNPRKFILDFGMDITDVVVR